jgi:hypothetical protein
MAAGCRGFVALGDSGVCISAKVKAMTKKHVKGKPRKRNKTVFHRTYGEKPTHLHPCKSKPKSKPSPAVPIHEPAKPAPLKRMDEPYASQDASRVAASPAVGVPMHHPHPGMEHAPHHTPDPPKPTVTTYSASMRWFDLWGSWDVKETIGVEDINACAARANLVVELRKQGWTASWWRWNKPECAEVIETTWWRWNKPECAEVIETTRSV